MLDSLRQAVIGLVLLALPLSLAAAETNLVKQPLDPTVFDIAELINMPIPVVSASGFLQDPSLAPASVSIVTTNEITTAASWSWWTGIASITTLPTGP